MRIYSNCILINDRFYEKLYLKNSFQEQLKKLTEFNYL